VLCKCDFQVAADLEYLCNVYAALGEAVPLPLDTFMRCAVTDRNTFPTLVHKCEMRLTEIKQSKSLYTPATRLCSCPGGDLRSKAATLYPRNQILLPYPTAINLSATQSPASYPAPYGASVDASWWGLDCVRPSPECACCLNYGEASLTSAGQLILFKVAIACVSGSCRRHTSESRWSRYFPWC
jgi:hypothetical protein